MGVTRAGAISGLGGQGGSAGLQEPPGHFGVPLNMKIPVRLGCPEQHSSRLEMQPSWEPPEAEMSWPAPSTILPHHTSRCCQVPRGEVPGTPHPILLEVVLPAHTFWQGAQCQR